MRAHVLRDRVRYKAIVTTKAGSTFEGVLYDLDRDAVVLRNVVHLVQGADQPTPVDGELLILAADVLFMQFP